MSGWGPRPWAERDRFTVTIEMSPAGAAQIRAWLARAEVALSSPGHPATGVFGAPDLVARRFRETAPLARPARLSLADAATLRVTMAGLHAVLPQCLDTPAVHPTSPAVLALTQFVDDLDAALQ